MSERAQLRAPAEAAAEAVKAYIRMNRAKLALDGELLALLLPERFPSTDVRDLQRYALERLTNENAALRAERDGLKFSRERAARLGEDVQRAVLDLVDARSFEETISLAKNSAHLFGLDRASICVEGEEGARSTTGVRLVSRGTSDALLGTDAAAVVSHGAQLLLGAGGIECNSIAAFRLHIGEPAALYVVGARASHRFDDEIMADLSFFARALERAIRAWLDLPKL